MSPDIFEVLYLVGRTKTVERLRRGRDIIRHNRELPGPAVEPVGADRPVPAAVPPPPPGAEPAADVDFAAGDWGDERPPGDA